MPWDAKSFQKHNKNLHGKALSNAAKQATGALRSGVPEGEAIAIANKHAKGLRMSNKPPMKPSRRK